MPHPQADGFGLPPESAKDGEIERAISPVDGMLCVMTRDEMLAAAKAELPMVGEMMLAHSVNTFLRVCERQGVVLLHATPNDATTIRQRVAIGWSDDRP